MRVLSTTSSLWGSQSSAGQGRSRVLVEECNPSGVVVPIVVGHVSRRRRRVRGQGVIQTPMGNIPIGLVALV